MTPFYGLDTSRALQKKSLKFRQQRQSEKKSDCLSSVTDGCQFFFFSMSKGLNLSIQLDHTVTVCFSSNIMAT